VLGRSGFLREESEKSRVASKILEESSTAKNFREGKLI